MSFRVSNLTHDGLLVLSRENSRDFLFQYALLGNRPIHVSRIAASETTRARLRERFNARHHIQQRQLDVQTALREDNALIQRWLRQSIARNGGGDRSTLRIPAAGYFLPASPTEDPQRIDPVRRAAGPSGQLASAHSPARRQDRSEPQLLVHLPPFRGRAPGAGDSRERRLPRAIPESGPPANGGPALAGG